MNCHAIHFFAFYVKACNFGNAQFWLLIQSKRVLSYSAIIGFLYSASQKHCRILSKIHIKLWRLKLRAYISLSKIVRRIMPFYVLQSVAFSNKCFNMASNWPLETAFVLTLLTAEFHWSRHKFWYVNWYVLLRFRYTIYTVLLHWISQAPKTISL